MSAPVLDRPDTTSGRTQGRRALAAVAVAAVIGLLTALAGALLSTPVRVMPTFPDEVAATETDWGSPAVFGVVGSRILPYEHDTSVRMRLPWTGGPVIDARLGDEPVHLLTVTDVVRDTDELVLTLYRGNCRYFHERAIDVFAGIDLTLASGRTTEVLFDRPLLVKSPMLASCPDRTLNRQDDARSDYRGRG